MLETGRKRRQRQARRWSVRDMTWERRSVTAVGAKLPTAYGQEGSRNGPRRTAGAKNWQGEVDAVRRRRRGRKGEEERGEEEKHQS